jgi:hypothetical protein
VVDVDAFVQLHAQKRGAHGGVGDPELRFQFRLRIEGVPFDEVVDVAHGVGAAHPPALLRPSPVHDRRREVGQGLALPDPPPDEGAGRGRELHVADQQRGLLECDRRAAAATMSLMVRPAAAELRPQGRLPVVD